jgi:hypothetical protein
MDVSKELSQNVYAVRMRKYYNSLEGEKKDNLMQQMMKYKNKRYKTDDEYRKKVCEQSNNNYKVNVKNNPQIIERRRIISYVHGLNMKRKAGVNVAQTKKFTEYDIFYCEELGVYLSRRLINDDGVNTVA